MRLRGYVLSIMTIFLTFIYFNAYAEIIRVPGDYPTIQEGIEAAGVGDTVLVNDGLYEERIDFLGKVITVKSVNGPRVTTIDGSHLGSVVSFVNGEGPNSVIDGFTITNGSGTYAPVDGYAGGGIYCRHPNGSVPSFPTIINNIITANSVTGSGAGVYGHEFNGVIRNNIISGNSAGGSGGGIYLRDVRTTTTLEGNTITQNTATGDGGGISIGTYGTPNIIGNTITFNNAGVNGGGIEIHEYVNGAGYLTIENNIISNNSASLSGGGIASVVNGRISNNTITENTAVSLGGGIFVQQDVSGIISNNMIKRNSVANPDWNLGTGGGIACYDNSNPEIVNNTIAENFAFANAGGIFCWSGSSPLIEGNFISKNSTDLNYTWASGGGIDCSSDSDAEIKNNLIVENSSVYGGGISSFASSHQISNNLICENSAVKRGGGVCLNGSVLSADTFVLTNNTLTSNTAVEMGGGIYCMSYGEVTQINDILWGNEAALGPEIALGWGSNDEITFTTNYSDVQGGQPQIYIFPYAEIILNWGSRMIDVDPLFINAEADHYSLEQNSPCINSGDPNILDPDNTVSNMGAYGGPEAKIVNITLFTDQTQVPRGQTLEYTALLSNNFSETFRVFAGSEVILPDGSPYPGMGPLPINFNPYQTIQRQVIHHVPNNAPLGDYIYIGKVGTRELGVIDESSFNFEVINP